MDARKCSHLTLLLMILLNVSLVAVCASNPFNRGGNPFNTGDNPYNSGDNPFNNGDNHFNSGDNPFNNRDNPYYSGDNPFNNGDNPFNSGNNPFNNGDKTYNSGNNSLNNKETSNYLCCINNKDLFKGSDFKNFQIGHVFNFCPFKAINQTDFIFGLQMHIIYNVNKEEYNSCRINQAPSDIGYICGVPPNPEAGCQESKPEQEYYYILKPRKGSQYRADGCCSMQRIKVSSQASPEERHDALMTKLGISGSSHGEVGVFMFAISLLVGLM
ncbi:unnamed protein product [Meganyctiphanes norvegica]|uniref:Uncharacterized protein n=1 Tax=Meganyctiphanes norvegica TaxID=48144 RepID=A0AAV2QZT9_MEGNR